MDGASKQVGWLKNQLPVLLVLLASVLTAGAIGAKYWKQSDQLWWGYQHDRQAHYVQGLTLGMSLRQGDVVSFFQQIERIQVWGILHPLLEGIVQAAVGPDHRLGMVPSLAGFVGCAVFAFLLARRAVASMGNFAGCFAALFVLVSPAHRSFAVDVMLESLGACFSLALLYFYLVFVQEGTRTSAIRLTVLWTLLFFHKYNYWLLASFAILGNESWRHRALLAEYLKGAEWAPGLKNAARRPLLWMVAGLTIASIGIVKFGPMAFSALGRSWTLAQPHGLLHLAFGLLCLEFFLWYRHGGRETVAQWPQAARILVFGQGIPMALWFLLPRRLGTFFWFLSPANNGHHVERYVPFYGFSFYTKGMLEDYLVEPWLWLVVLGFGLLAVFPGNLRKGTGALMLFLAISLVLTMHHPMLKNRFMHSWIAIAFVLAGVGFANALTGLARVQPWLGPSAGAAGFLTLAFLVSPFALSPGHSEEAGVRPRDPSVLELSLPYLDYLQADQKVQFLCNDLESWSLKWTLLEKSKRPKNIKLDISGFNRQTRDPAVLDRWLAGNQSDVVVFVHIPKTSPYYVGNGDLDYAPLQKSMKERGLFDIRQEWTLKQGEKISLWTRTSPPQVSQPTFGE